MRKMIAICLAALLILSLFAGCHSTTSSGPTISPEEDYQAALALMQEEKYTEAAALFQSLGNYSDSQKQYDLCQKNIRYTEAMELLARQQYRAAKKIFEELLPFKDSVNMVSRCSSGMKYLKAVDYIEQKSYADAYYILKEITDLPEAAQLLSSFKSITLTSDNWDTYFSITTLYQGAVDYVDSFFNQTHYKLARDLVVKRADGAPGFWPEKETLTLNFKGTFEIRHVSLDQNGQCVFKACLWNYPPITDTLSVSMKNQRIEVASTKNWEDQDHNYTGFKPCMDYSDDIGYAAPCYSLPYPILSELQLTSASCNIIVYDPA